LLADAVGAVCNELIEEGFDVNSGPKSSDKCSKLFKSKGVKAIGIHVFKAFLND